MVWLFPAEPSRSRRCARLFRIMLAAHYLPSRTVWTTQDIEGAALWSPPGHWNFTNAELARNALGMLASLGRHTGRALRLLSTMDKAHPAEPHWYLGVLGTSPAHQGKGIGSALLQPVLDRCDAEGMPAYLESSKESNIAFYARHGFELRGEITLPGGPTIWPMWRDPRAGR